MNCAYHSVNNAVVNCNGCGKPLCAACDHRIKGFPYCQDCIVEGVGMLRDRRQMSAYVPIVKKQTSPFFATVLSMICPGLGAAYNGQMSKALVHFAVFAGLFQLAVISHGTALFVLGFIGMWFFSALDSYRTAQTIRSGVTPNEAEDILFQRLSSNPKLWGVVLVVIGALFFLQNLIRPVLRNVIPVMIIALGLYMLRNYYLKLTSRKKESRAAESYTDNYSGSLNQAAFRTGDFDRSQRECKRGGWRS